MDFVGLRSNCPLGQSAEHVEAVPRVGRVGCRPCQEGTAIMDPGDKDEDYPLSSFSRSLKLVPARSMVDYAKNTWCNAKEKLHNYPEAPRRLIP